MSVLFIVLLVVLVISAVLLVLVVLVQDDQGEGIGGIFGGGSNTAFGSRAGNVLTRFTATLAAIFLVCCFGVAWISRTPEGGDVIKASRQQSLAGTADTSWYASNASTGTSTTTTAGDGTGTTTGTTGTSGNGGQ